MGFRHIFLKSLLNMGEYRPWNGSGCCGTVMNLSLRTINVSNRSLRTVNVSKWFISSINSFSDYYNKLNMGGRMNVTGVGE